MFDHVSFISYLQYEYEQAALIHLNILITFQFSENSLSRLEMGGIVMLNFYKMLEHLHFLK